MERGQLMGPTEGNPHLLEGEDLPKVLTGTTLPRERTYSLGAHSNGVDERQWLEDTLSKMRACMEVHALEQQNLVRRAIEDHMGLPPLVVSGPIFQSASRLVEPQARNFVSAEARNLLPAKPAEVGPAVQQGTSSSTTLRHRKKIASRLTRTDQAVT